MIEIELNQQIKLEWTDIFTILNLPIVNTEYFAMYLILLLFLSEFCSFPHIAPVHVLLDLKLHVGWDEKFVRVFGNVLMETSFFLSNMYIQCYKIPSQLCFYFIPQILISCILTFI